MYTITMGAVEMHVPFSFKYGLNRVKIIGKQQPGI